ncbi:MAG: exopolysaccharide biosynthesis polyprenyl glycosylphosphotransferase, partial [Hungatella sp.]
MIKDNQKSINRFHVLLDGIVILLSYVLAWFIQIGSGWFVDRHEALTPAFYMSALLLVIPIHLLLYAIFHLYAPKRVQGRRVEFANICKANLLGLLIFTMALFLGAKNPYLYNFSRKMVLLFAVLNIVLETIMRNAIRMTLYSVRSNGYNQKHILLVGYSRAAEGFIDRVQQNPEWGYRIRGILDDHTERGTQYHGIKVIGTIPNLEMILEQNTLDEIAITLSLKEYANLEEIVSSCEKSGVHTKFIPDYNNMVPTRPYIEDLQGLPVINIRHVPLNDPLNIGMKRGVDIAGALFGIVLFSPVMLITAAMIKLTSKGPLIYSQERVGLHNRSFKMYKFRSMEVQTTGTEKSQWTTPHDPRVTPIGKFIRKTSIDETPQFFNVLLGNMSLVGPR